MPDIMGENKKFEATKEDKQMLEEIEMMSSSAWNVIPIDYL